MLWSRSAWWELPNGSSGLFRSSGVAISKALATKIIIQRTTSGKSVRLNRARPKPGGKRVVRFSFILSAAVGFVTALMAIGCTTHSSTVVWEYYDQCAQENPSLLAMAECGRQKRLGGRAPPYSCF